MLFDSLITLETPLVQDNLCALCKNEMYIKDDLKI